jgi:hypothetical protein
MNGVWNIPTFIADSFVQQRRLAEPPVPLHSPRSTFAPALLVGGSFDCVGNAVTSTISAARWAECDLRQATNIGALPIA